VIFRKSKRIRALEAEIESLKAATNALRDRLDAVCPGSFDTFSPFREEQEQLFRTHCEKRQKWYKAKQKKEADETE
jgi:hypothetical protein